MNNEVNNENICSHVECIEVLITDRPFHLTSYNIGNEDPDEEIRFLKTTVGESGPYTAEQGCESCLHVLII